MDYREVTYCQNVIQPPSEPEVDFNDFVYTSLFRDGISTEMIYQLPRYIQDNTTR